MWRALATLPAVFRDGVAQDDKTDPWVLTNLVRTEFAQLRATAPPLTRLENRLSIVMAWWLVPVTLFALWARYLPAHDISGLTWLAFLIGATTFFGRYTFGLARAKLRGEVPPAGSTPPGGRSRTLLSRVLRELSRVRCGQIIIWFLLPFLIIVALSISASDPIPTRCPGQRRRLLAERAEHVLREIDPTPAKLLNFVRVRTYADLREVEVAQMPQDWDGKDWGEIKRVELRDQEFGLRGGHERIPRQCRPARRDADRRPARLRAAAGRRPQGGPAAGRGHMAGPAPGRPPRRGPPPARQPHRAPISRAPTSARPNSGAPPSAGPISRAPTSGGPSSRALTSATRSCRAPT